MAYAVGHRTQAGARAYANALERIVSNGGAIGEVPRERRVVGGIGGSSKSEYNGYFKIIDASERDKDGSITKPIIKVVDGQSYSAETGESESMLCLINGSSYHIQSTTIELQKRNYTVGLMIHLHSGSDNIETYLNSPPDQTAHDFYKPFGRVQIMNTVEGDTRKWVMNVLQDHTAGILEGTWFTVCGDLVKDEQ